MGWEQAPLGAGEPFLHVASGPHAWDGNGALVLLPLLACDDCGTIL